MHQFAAGEGFISFKVGLLGAQVVEIISSAFYISMGSDHKSKGAASGVYQDAMFDTSPVAGKVYKNSENRRKQGVSCDFRCICRCSICPIRAQLRFV